MTKLIAVLIFAGVIAPCAALASGASVECDFRALTSAQRDAQTEAKDHAIPALLGQIGDTITPVPLDGVYIPDPEIQRKIMVQDVFAHRTFNKSVEIVVRVTNCTDYPLQILGRTSFMDANQVPTEDPSGWQTVFVDPRSFATYKEVSIGGADVESYLIEFRSNR